MPASPELIERSGDLKRDLLEFAQGRRFARAFEAALPERFGPVPEIEEDAFSGFLDAFMLQHRLVSGRTVVDQFVAAHPELPEPERAMLRGWQEVVEGIFAIHGRDGNTVGDEWLLSGVSSTLPAAARDEVYRWAAELARQHPALVFRNPAKLERAWQLRREERRSFIEFFGADLIVVAGHEACQASWYESGRNARILWVCRRRLPSCRSACRTTSSRAPTSSWRGPVRGAARC